MLFENGISDAPSPVAVADAPDDRSGLTSSAVATGAARETGWRQKLQEQDPWRRAAPRSWQVMDGCASYGEAKDSKTIRSARRRRRHMLHVDGAAAARAACGSEADVTLSRGLSNRQEASPRRPRGVGPQDRVPDRRLLVVVSP
jgi:hypothetical protein